MPEPTPIRLLNVNDDDTTRYSLTRILERAGFIVEEAVTGTEALDKVRECPDLVVLDVNLPDINGFEVCQRIKEDTDTSSIPVLHISATAVAPSDRAFGLETGADAYLVQPVNSQELIATVGSLLRTRRAEEQAREASRQWQVTFDAISDGVCLLDDKGRVQQCNRAMSELLGLPLEKIRNRSLTDIEEEMLGILWDDQLILPHAVTEREVYEVRAGKRWFRITVDPVRDEENRISGAVHILSEITKRKKDERAVEESELRYRRLVETANEGIWLLDAEAKIQYVNRRMTDMLGYPTEEMIGKSALDFFLDEGDSTASSGGELHENRRSEQIDLRLKCFDGGTLWALACTNPILSEEGDFLGALGMFTDVTQRKRMEETLRATEERLRLAVESANIGAWDYDPVADDMKWSDRCKAMFGLPAEANVNDYEFISLVQPEDRFIVDQAIKDALDPTGEGDFDVEYRTLRPDGTQRWIVAKGRAVFEGEGKDRRAVRFIGTALDITERKRIEEAFRFLADASSILASTLNYQDTLDRLAQLAVPQLADWCTVDILEDDGSIRLAAVIHVDPAKVEYAKEQRRLNPPDMNAEHGSMKAILTGEPQVYPIITDELIRQSAKDDEHLRIMRELSLRSAMCVPLTARGRTLGVINLVSAESGRIYDSHDLALAEELARRAAIAIDNARLYREVESANRAKEQFLAMLGHELRNPIGAISNAIQVMRMRGSDDAVVERAQDVVDRQVRHQARLIDDLLDVSRITSGKIGLHCDRLDLREVVRHTVEDHRAMLDELQIALTVEMPAEPVWVEGDATRLSQVLGNLLTNASKFTDTGGRVAVRLSSDTGHGRAHLSVSDSGIGMEPELLSRVFDTFTQADRSLDRTQGGLGLGLALVKGIMELHHGGVRATSVGPGNGSTFTVWLPLDDSKEKRKREPVALSVNGSATARRVLIIEDNRDAADILCSLLELSGHEVKVAYTGTEGVNAARLFLPDVVLCDVGLPEMDGYAVARELRGSSDTSQARLIAISGYGQEEDVRRARDAGFDRHLTKPVDPEEIHRLLAEGG